MNRYKLLEENRVNNIYEITDSKIILIDDFDQFMYCTDYKVIDSIKSSIVHLVRLSKPAGFVLVITTSSASYSVIPLDLWNQTANIIILGNIIDNNVLNS